MDSVAECAWAGGPGSVSCSHAETQTDLPACCGSFIISLMQQLASAQSKLLSDNWPRPEVTAALPSAAPAADPAVAVQTGTGAAGRTELADDNTLKQGPDVEPQAPVPAPTVTDSLQRSAGEASQEAQTAPRTGSTVAAPQAVVTVAGIQLVYDEDLDIKIEDFNLTESDTSQQGAAPGPDGQTAPEAGRSGADPSPAALGPSRPVRIQRKRCWSPSPPPEPVRRRRRSSGKQKAAAASEQSADSSSSAPADGPAARPQPQPLRTAHGRPVSAGSSTDIGAVVAQPHAGSRFHCCPQCGRAFATRSHLQHHELTHTRERPFACEVCGKTFSQKGNLNTHRRTHTGEQTFSCEECGKTFSQMGSLVSHRHIHTGEMPYSCEECGKTFIREANLIHHRRIHEQPYICEECGRKFSEQRTLIAHRRTHTGGRPFSCKECGRKFREQGTLAKHRCTHTGEQPFSCEECGRKFSEKRYLVIHRRIHSDDRPYSCEKCGQKFKHQSNLNEHRRTHTGERPYTCGECGRKFRTRSSFDIHCRTHTGEQPFSCEECGQKFSEKRYLVIHRRIHNDDRPYSCEKCGQKFRHQSHLNDHRRTHTGERPYTCEECGRKFRTRSNFNTHCRTHTGKRPSVRCSCGRKFSPQTAPSNSSTARQLQCAACRDSAALKKQDLQAPPRPLPPATPQPVPVKQEPPVPEQSTDPLAMTDLTAAAGASTDSTGLAGSVELKTASVSYRDPLSVSPGSVPACNRPAPYQTAQDLPNSSLRSYPSNQGHFPAPGMKATKNEDSDVADDPDPELESDDNSEPQRDLSYWRKVSSQQKKSISKRTVHRYRRSSDSSDGDESPIERRVTPARSAKQRNSIQATNLKSRCSGEDSDKDADQFEWTGSESSWRDSSAESSEEG